MKTKKQEDKQFEEENTKWFKRLSFHATHGPPFPKMHCVFNDF